VRSRTLEGNFFMVELLETPSRQANQPAGVGHHARPSQPKRNGRSILVTALVVAALGAGLFVLRGRRQALAAPYEAPPVAVAATAVKPTEVPVALETVGSLRAVREVVLAPELAGRIVTLHFESGARVRAGDRLVQLYDAPERADRAAAQARASLARSELARSVTLASTGVEPKQLLERRQADVDQAAASMQQLDARIAQKSIRAPFDGQLGVRQVSLGQYLNPGDAIATLADIDQLLVDFSLPQQELAQVRVGATVRITTDAFPERSFTAKVNAVEPRINPDTRNLQAQAVLANGDGALRPGMHVNVALELPPGREALVLPATAVQSSSTGDSVVVVRGDQPEHAGTAEVLSVTIGRRIGDRVVVVQGLEPGAVVITEGQLRVQPGMRVQVTRGADAGAR